jgi:hypothetical protein
MLSINRQQTETAVTIKSVGAAAATINRHSRKKKKKEVASHCDSFAHGFNQISIVGKWLGSFVFWVNTKTALHCMTSAARATDESDSSAVNYKQQKKKNEIVVVALCVLRCHCCIDTKAGTHAAKGNPLSE